MIHPYIWQTDLRVRHLIQGLPWVSRVANQIEYDPSYYCMCNAKTHGHVIFDYTISGRGCFEDETGMHELTAGTVFLCVAGDPNVKYYYPPDGKDGWDFLWTVMHGAAVEAAASMISRFGGIYRLGTSHPLIERLSAFRKNDCEILDLDMFESASLANETFRALWESTALGQQKKYTPLVDRCFRIMRYDSEDGGSVAELARRLSVSREHLSRVFHAETGRPLMQQVREEKARRACQLLQDSQLSNKEIAARLGFSSASNFSRMFRSIIGYSPAEYRSVGPIMG